MTDRPNLLKPGSPVATVVPLGAMRSLEATRFAADLPAGTMALYRGPHPGPSLEGWHVLELTHDGEDLVIPVGPEHFDRIRLTEGEHAELIRRSGPGRALSTSFGSSVKILPDPANAWAVEVLEELRS